MLHSDWLFENEFRKMKVCFNVSVGYHQMINGAQCACLIYKKTRPTQMVNLKHSQTKNPALNEKTKLGTWGAVVIGILLL